LVNFFGKPQYIACYAKATINILKRHVLILGSMPSGVPDEAVRDWGNYTHGIRIQPVQKSKKSPFRAWKNRPESRPAMVPDSLFRRGSNQAFKNSPRAYPAAMGKIDPDRQAGTT
jgi:hypothetical protein